jgi:hypothetical protein
MFSEARAGSRKRNFSTRRCMWRGRRGPRGRLYRARGRDLVPPAAARL